MKIIATHVPAGAGHQKAAEAICAVLKEHAPSAETILLNALDGMSDWYQWSFTQGYLDMIQRYPHAWGTAYHLLDLRGLAWAAYKLHRLSNASHGKTLEGILERYKPDVIIGTHFFPMEVASYLKMKGRIHARLITVITDFLPHSVWISPGIDRYAVAAEWTRVELIRRGVPEDRIQVTGIPIHPKFAHKGNRAELTKKLGLRAGVWTVLIGSGGFGTGPVESIFKQFAEIREPLQILVVTGKNTALFHRLEAEKELLPQHAVTLYGFVDNMDELMEVSDLMVTKPGGLSCAEAMAKELPLLLTAPIPGQESRNARLLQQAGIAVQARRLQEIPRQIHELRNHPDRLRHMAELGRKASFPDAAGTVARLAKSLTEEVG